MKKSPPTTNSTDRRPGLRCDAQARTCEGVFTGAITILGATSLCFGALLGGRLSAAADAKAENEPALTAIVVTANKRGENLQAFPSSVSVENGEQLIQRGQTQLTDY